MMDYQGFLDGISERVIWGWVYNQSDPDSSLVVQVVINGAVMGFSLADQYRNDLASSGIGNGRHAFEFAVPERIPQIVSVETYVANSSYRLPSASNDFRFVNEFSQLPASVGSNLGKWDRWYENLDSQTMSAFRYGDTVTYRMAAAFMVDVKMLEDWGCGAAGFKRFYRGSYVGVDGSHTPFADRIVDLCEYESNADGILIRHVLEHNYRWEAILDAAVRSFNKKLCLILFTPFADRTKEIAQNRQHGVDVPDICFCRQDIERKFSDLRWELFQDIATPTGYGMEHVYFVWKTSGDSLTSVRNRSRPFAKLALTTSTLRHSAALIRKPKRALYTAIFGNYDRLKDIPQQLGVDLICFTDDTKLQHPRWQVRYVQPKYAHPRLSAKYYKMLSHVALFEYEEVLWVDGSFEVQDPNFAKDVFEYLEAASIAVCLHPERGCIYDEASLCQPMAKYCDQNIVEQVAYYREQGFPAKWGLFAAGIVARRNDDSTISHLNEAWMEENEKWTYHDQLSLPYVLWKLRIKPAIFRQYLWNSRWGAWMPHAHER
jgi:hypothetical protein